MSNYIFKRTDPANATIIVQPFTANGPATPASPLLYHNDLSGITAVNSSTSLVLSGKGVPEYGELVQNNLIYLTENFAGPKRPRNPLEGQLWYKNAAGADSFFPSDPTTAGLYMWNETEWSSILLNDVNPGNADDRYVQLTGSTMPSGAFLSLTSSPTAPLHATNKQYVDDAIDSIVSGSGFLATTGGTVAGVLIVDESADPLVDSVLTLTPTVGLTLEPGAGVVDFGNRVIGNIGTPVAADDAATKGYADTMLPLVGGTVNGTLVIDESADPMVTTALQLTGDVAFTVQPGAGTVYFGNRVITGVGAPVVASDAATKAYVDAGTGAILTTGSLSPAGELTLTLSNSTVVTVAGAFAQAVHTHTDTSLTYTIPIASQSYLTPQIINNFGTFPTATMTSVLRTLDRGLYLARAPIQRHVVEAVGGVTTFTLPFQSTYAIGYNRIQVFVDGIKQMASDRGNSRIKFNATPLGVQSPIGLAAGTYNTTFSLDGGAPFVIATDVVVNQTYRDLANSLNFIFAGSPSATVPATSGRATLSWTGLTTGGATGLANSATTYTATITVDGVPQPISIVGSTAQTFGELVVQLNTDLAGTATAVIFSATEMRITSATTGVSSTMLVTDTNLFSSLTGYGSPSYTAGAALIPSAPTTTVYGITVRIEQYNNTLVFVLESPTVGTGSEVTTSYLGGELFTSIITSSAPIDSAVTADYDYEEVGAVDTVNNVIEFLSAPTVGQLIEFITYP